MQRNPLPALTGLRFVAAATVVLAHALPNIVPLPGERPLWYWYLVQLAGIGMTLFFVLSSFVIHYNYADKLAERPVAGTYNFFVARFARLYPLYIACVAYDWLHAYAYYQLPDYVAQAAPYYLTMTQTWTFRVLGDHNLVHMPGVMVPITWSISTEWFFYCVYPLICLGLYRVRALKSVVCCGGVFIMAAAAIIVIEGYFGDEINTLGVAAFGPVANWTPDAPGESFLRWMNYLSPYAQLPNFILGCFCAEVYTRLANRSISHREQNIGAALSVGAIAMLLATLAVVYYPPILSAMWVINYSAILAPPIAVLIFCCARYWNPIVRALSARWVVFCGEVSYSIYLLHLPIIMAFRWEAAKVTDGRVAIGNVLALAFASLAIVGLSYVTYSIIETPARRWLTRWLSIRRRAPAPA